MKCGNHFLIDSLFEENEIPMVYSDIDRSITGSAVPTSKTLKLIATKKEMAANYFTEVENLELLILVRVEPYP